MQYEMQSKGGRARAAKLSPERRREIALVASRARWEGWVKVTRERKPRETIGVKLRRLSNEWWLTVKSTGGGYHNETVRALVEYVEEHWR